MRTTICHSDPESRLSPSGHRQAVADVVASVSLASAGGSGGFSSIAKEHTMSKATDRNADEDHQHRIDYLRSLRVRGE